MYSIRKFYEIDEGGFAAVNPIEDQRKEALKHYHEASSAIHHWSGFVEAAIKAYNPAPTSSPGEQVGSEGVETVEEILKFTEWVDENVTQIEKGKWACKEFEYPCTTKELFDQWRGMDKAITYLSKSLQSKSNFCDCGQKPPYCDVCKILISKQENNRK